MKIIFLAVSAMLFIEGMMLGIFPKLWQQAMLDLAQRPTKKIREIGLMMAIGGLVSLWYCLKW